MNSEATHPEWTGQTDGSSWMLRSLIVMLRFIPLQVMYFVADVVVIFYMIFRPTATHSQYTLFRLRFGQGRLRATLSAYKNMCTFGKVVIDRFAVYGGKRFNIKIENNEWLEQCYQSNLPLVIMSGHIGNFELAGYFLKPKCKQMYVLLYGGEKDVVMQNRAKQLTPNDIHLIAAQGNSDYLFEINNALSGGHLFAILADRALGSRRTIKVNILDKQAALPLGPFRTALLHKANICTAFVIKQGVHSYIIHLTPITGTTPQELADSYASEMTKVLQKYPYQWFNYYNFWKD